MVGGCRVLSFDAYYATKSVELISMRSNQGCIVQSVSCVPSLPRTARDQRATSPSNLKVSDEQHNDGDQYFNILLHANADSVLETFDSAKTFGAATADVVVGNPPWGYPKPDDLVGRTALEMALAWCSKRGHTIGDQELSQAFIHLALYLPSQGQ